MRGLHTAPVICWRSVWRWGPRGQHRFLGRLVTHHLGLVPSFSCSFWRPGACHLLLSAVQVWGRWGLQEVWMVFFQTCSRTHSERLPVVDSPDCWGMVSCIWQFFSYLSTLLAFRITQAWYQMTWTHWWYFWQDPKQSKHKVVMQFAHLLQFSKFKIN